MKQITIEQLFEKYSINESHSQWNDKIDNWISIEIFRIMHNGRLPTEKDFSPVYILDFLKKKNSDFKWWTEEIMTCDDWGSLYLTSKRMLYRNAYSILSEINIDSNGCL
ncbi:MAG: hypothetical protein ABI549_13100 [Flavobacterium sp.]|uniref:hypothetical protein n=1 Tax=Flavobacterium sp. TaxID=239 RepID=UPI003266F5AA